MRRIFKKAVRRKCCHMYKYLLSDFHGTIVDANSAWIKAYEILGAKNMDDVIRRVYQKERRKNIADDYNLNYDEVVETYRQNLHIRPEVVKLLHNIPGSQNIIIVSNAHKDKLYKDIKQVEKEHDLNICDVFCKEDGCKKEQSLYPIIIAKYHIKNAYMVGNDIREDFCLNSIITNIFIPYKKTLLYNDKL